MCFPCAQLCRTLASENPPPLLHQRCVCSKRQWRLSFRTIPLNRSVHLLTCALHPAVLQRDSFQEFALAESIWMNRFENFVRRKFPGQLVRKDALQYRLLSIETPCRSAVFQILTS